MFTTRLSDWTWQNIFIRMAISLALGIVIGIDRGATRRGGGARPLEYAEHGGRGGNGVGGFPAAERRIKGL